jgi:hypothetical protein
MSPLLEDHIRHSAPTVAGIFSGDAGAVVCDDPAAAPIATASGGG